jgi:hypothetical protein
MLVFFGIGFGLVLHVIVFGTVDSAFILVGVWFESG